ATQSAARALGAHGAPAVAAGQHAVLDLVALLLQVAEEGIDATQAAPPLPQQLALFGREVAVGAVDGEAVRCAGPLEGLAPLAHLLAGPRGHTALVHAQALVGDHQVGVDADHMAIAFAHRTGA